jgi:hypothetical protein
MTESRTSAAQLCTFTQMHWHIAKLLELGVDEEWLASENISLEQARDLIKGLLYLRERKDLRA